MILCLKAGRMHLLSDLPFFSLDLGGILKGQDTAGIVIFSFNGYAVYQKRKIMGKLQIIQNL